MSLKFGLSEAAVKGIQGVFGRFPEIEKAVLYGSRAKGTAKNGSDIDLTLCGNKLNLDIQRRVMEELDDLLLPYMIDLSILADISDSSVVEHIERVGVVFYEKAD